MNALTPDTHQQGDYQILIDAVEQELLSSQPDPSITVSTEPSQEKQILDRRLDVAMPDEFAEEQEDSLPEDQMGVHPRPSRKRSHWSPAILVALFVGILAALATIVGALIQIVPFVAAYLSSTPVYTSAPPACITEDDILVRLQIWKGPTQMDTVVPFERFTLAPDEIVDLRVSFESVSGQPVPKLECAWDNANSEDITSPTEGALLHAAGCIVDYQSGRSKIADTLSLQVSQAGCSNPLSYAFFVFPQ